MAKGTIGTKIVIDGDKEYKQSISDLCKTQDVLKSEMALANSEFDKSDDKEKKLTATGKILEQQVKAQTDKIKVLEQAVKNSTEKTGENSRKTQDWQIKLNKAKAELNSLNGQLGDNKKALDDTKNGIDDASKSTESFGSQMGDILPGKLGSAVKALSSTNTSMLGLAGVLAGVIAGLAKCSTKTAHTADDLMTLSSTTGLSTDALQEFEYASEFVDVSTDTMTGSLTKMTKTMDAARNGTKLSADAYKSLGIKITDSKGQLRDANTVFYEAIDKLGQMKNETERDALSMQIFGKSAKELNPLIEAGSGKLAELSEEAHKMGYVMDNETLQSFGQLDDAMQKTSKQSDAIKNSLALALLPVLTTLFKTISAIPTPVLTLLITLAGVITTVLLAVKAIKGITDGVKSVKAVTAGLDAKALKTTAIIMGIVVAVTLLAVAIAAITGKSNDFNRSLDSMSGTIGQMNGQVQSAQTSNVYGRIPQYARGTSYHQGGRAIVGEDGPELVDLPTGSKVYDNDKTKKMLQGSQTVNNYIFKVDDIATYVAIENRLKNQQQTARAY